MTVTNRRMFLLNELSTGDIPSRGRSDSLKTSASSSSMVFTRSSAHSSDGQVQFSSAAGALLSPFDDVRMDKVRSFQVSIANGNYNVSSFDVANKLIEHMLE